MFNGFTFHVIFLCVIALLILVNRSALVDPRMPLIGLFIVVILWCAAGLYTVVNYYQGYVKGLLTLDLVAFCRLAFSILPCLLVLVFLLKLKQYPPIHDVSTDTTLPPQFQHVESLRHTMHHSVEYNHQFSQLQHSSYPSIRPLFFDLPPSILLSAIEVLVNNESWVLHHVDVQKGVIEASESTPILGFVDDIVIRVQVSGSGSRVDIRSASRIGVSDLGANASRVAQFSASLDFVAERLVTQTEGVELE